MSNSKPDGSKISVRFVFVVALAVCFIQFIRYDATRPTQGLDQEHELLDVPTTRDLSSASPTKYETKAAATKPQAEEQDKPRPSRYTPKQKDQLTTTTKLPPKEQDLATVAKTEPEDTKQPTPTESLLLDKKASSDRVREKSDGAKENQSEKPKQSKTAKEAKKEKPQKTKKKNLPAEEKQSKTATETPPPHETKQVDVQEEAINAQPSDAKLPKNETKEAAVNQEHANNTQPSDAKISNNGEETTLPLSNPKISDKVEETTLPVSKELELVQGDKTTLFLYSNSNCSSQPVQFMEAHGKEPALLKTDTFPSSARVQGSGLAEVLRGEAGESYVGVLVEQDGCFDFDALRRWYSFNHVRFMVHTASNTDTAIFGKRQIPEALQKQFTTAADIYKPHTKIVFSVTSAHYFGYQVLASAFSFLDSNQTKSSWIRLLSAKQPDDLAERFPTFTAPRTPESNFYTPINKPDVIMKWFQSKDAPHPDDTIVVVDPDSWFLKDMNRWVSPVKRKKARGQKAFYEWNPTQCQELWRLFCLTNCDRDIDLVGVPYLLKASDLKEVAPWWKRYTMMLHARLEAEPQLLKKYETLGLAWAKEMYGYNFACAHLSVKSDVLKALQVRDIESKFAHKLYKQTPTIHMGRAWFPKKAATQAEQWRNSDDGGFNCKGNCIQVWCKCNLTASETPNHPWPLPDGLDFVSYHTLRILHDSAERFGPVPQNITFRNPRDPYYPSQ